MRFRPILGVLAYIGIGVLLCTHPALASSTGGGGGSGVFAAVVTFVTQFETAILLMLVPICVIFWFGFIGALVSGGGHMNGLAWGALVGALGTTLLLAIVAIVNQLGSGAMITVLHH